MKLLYLLLCLESQFWLIGSHNLINCFGYNVSKSLVLEAYIL